MFAGAQMAKIGGTCPMPHLDVNGNGNENCLILSQWGLGGSTSYLLDATNNTVVNSPTTFPNLYNYTYDYNRTSCSSFKCSYSNSTTAGATLVGNSLSTTFTWFFNSTMVKTHQYWAIVTLSGGAQSFVYEYPASTASASLNFATFGNGLNITSVKVV